MNISTSFTYVVLVYGGIHLFFFVKPFSSLFKQFNGYIRLNSQHHWSLTVFNIMLRVSMLRIARQKNPEPED